MRVTLRVVPALLGLFPQWSSPASVLAQVPIKEWPVPYSSSRPRDPYVDSQNRVWFVGQVGNYSPIWIPRAEVPPLRDRGAEPSPQSDRGSERDGLVCRQRQRPYRQAGPGDG